MREPSGPGAPTEYSVGLTCYFETVVTAFSEEDAIEQARQLASQHAEWETDSVLDL